MKDSTVEGIVAILCDGCAFTPADKEAIHGLVCDYLCKQGGPRMDGKTEPVLISHASGIFGTEVRLPDGSLLPLVYKVEWTHEIGNMPECTVYVRNSELDVETNARIVSVCPQCKENLEKT